MYKKISIPILIIMMLVPSYALALKPIKDTDLSKVNCPSGISMIQEQKTDKQTANNKSSKIEEKRRIPLSYKTAEPSDEKNSNIKELLEDPDLLVKNEKHNSQEQNMNVDNTNKSQTESSRTIYYSKGASEHPEYSIDYESKTRDNMTTRSRYIKNGGYDVQPNSWVDIKPR